MATTLVGLSDHRHTRKERVPTPVATVHLARTRPSTLGSRRSLGARQPLEPGHVGDRTVVNTFGDPLGASGWLADPHGSSTHHDELRVANVELAPIRHVYPKGLEGAPPHPPQHVIRSEHTLLCHASMIRGAHFLVNRTIYTATSAALADLAFDPVAGREAVAAAGRRIEVGVLHQERDPRRE